MFSVRCCRCCREKNIESNLPETTKSVRSESFESEVFVSFFKVEMYMERCLSGNMREIASKAVDNLVKDCMVFKTISRRVSVCECRRACKTIMEGLSAESMTLMSSLRFTSDGKQEGDRWSDSSPGEDQSHGLMLSR